MTGPTINLGTICLDCRDAEEMAQFYGGLLGWESTSTEPDRILMCDPAGGSVSRSRPRLPTSLRRTRRSGARSRG